MAIINQAVRVTGNENKARILVVQCLISDDQFEVIFLFFDSPPGLGIDRRRANHARPYHITPLKASLPVTVDPRRSRHGIFTCTSYGVRSTTYYVHRSQKKTAGVISGSRSTWQIDWLATAWIGVDKSHGLFGGLPDGFGAVKELRTWAIDRRELTNQEMDLL